jgi:hypothetical protein
LYFGLVDGKIESVKEYMLNYDDKSLYKMLWNIICDKNKKNKLIIYLQYQNIFSIFVK